MQLLHHMGRWPTWDDACESQWEDEQWQGVTGEIMPEPTVLATLVIMRFWWLHYHAVHLRCVLGGHSMGSWKPLHHRPEYTEEGHRLQGPMTGRVRNCTRCDYQHGQGEY